MNTVRIAKTSMILFIAITLFLTMSVFIFLQQAKFGRLPASDRLLKMKELPNYKDGSFQNISPTPDLTEGVSYWQVIKEFFLIRKRGSLQLTQFHL